MSLNRALINMIQSLFLNRNFNLESHEPTPHKKNGISKIVILKPQF
jgi:hypothetical protein